ncbi:protein of unknown function [Methylorubrum extorquens]|uniref:PAS domain-containing protein n=1 Tax=Methylorubrum extorquens TaxID=408 RepID=A0A2N9ARA6_METEX|nr:protein of unknown function [Methylorubrum extorquens]
MAEVSGPAVPASGSIDRSERPGRVGLLLMLAGLLVGAVVGLSFVANEQAQPLILALLALLAMAGVFFLFALAIGALQLAGPASRDDITRAIVDAAPEGKLVVEDNGRMIYANEAYICALRAATVSRISAPSSVSSSAPQKSRRRSIGSHRRPATTAPMPKRSGCRRRPVARRTATSRGTASRFGRSRATVAPPRFGR